MSNWSHTQGSSIDEYLLKPSVSESETVAYFKKIEALERAQIRRLLKEVTYTGNNDCIDPPLLKGIRTFCGRDRRCHELSIKTILKESEDTPWHLIQGYYRAEGLILPWLAHHSWLECGNLVYDAVKDKYYHRNYYNENFGAIGLHEFSRKTALALCVKNKKYGPLRFCGPNNLVYTMVSDLSGLAKWVES